MREKFDYERRLSDMVSRYVRRIISEDFNISSSVPDLDICFMDRPSDYYRFMSVLSTWLEPLDFEKRLRQAYSSPRVGVLLGWQNVRIYAVCPSEKLNSTLASTILAGVCITITDSCLLRRHSSSLSIVILRSACATAVGSTRLF